MGYDARTGMQIWRSARGPLIMLDGEGGRRIATDVILTRRKDKMRLAAAKGPAFKRKLMNVDEVEVAAWIDPIMGLTMPADLGGEVLALMKAATTQSATLKAAVRMKAKALADKAREMGREEDDEAPVTELDDERAARHEALADDWIAAIDAEGEW